MERLNDALVLGLREHEYWSMSWDEVIRFFEASNRRRLYEERSMAVFVHRLAELTGIAVCTYFNGHGEKFPKIEHVFPDLFDEDELNEAREERRQREMAERFILSAERWNARFNKENENGRDVTGTDNGGDI